MKKILIVEDEKPLRDAFAFLLTSEGFDVALAENGKVALAKLAKFRPDIIMLDMLMPVMNGVEFLQAALLPQAYPRTQTLLLSNLSDPIAPDNAHELGVTRSVLKADLSPMQLAAVVKDMVSIGSNEEET